jgi:hypothetical protein
MNGRILSDCNHSVDTTFLFNAKLITTLPLKTSNAHSTISKSPDVIPLDSITTGVVTFQLWEFKRRASRSALIVGN